MKLFREFINSVLENVYEEINASFDNYESREYCDNEDLLLSKEIYLDTSSFMCNEADMFFMKVVPLLERYGKQINTLSCCIREVNKHLNSNDYDKYNKALQAKERIEILNNSNLLNVIDYSDDVFADADFLSYFSKKRIHEEILFISQDGNLSMDVFKLNEMRSVNGYDIVVKTINQDGALMTHYKIEQYLEDDYEDDFCNEEHNCTIINNNTSGVNISAHEIGAIKTENHEIFVENVYSNHDKSPKTFWLHIE